MKKTHKQISNRLILLYIAVACLASFAGGFYLAVEVMSGYIRTAINQ